MTTNSLTNSSLEVSDLDGQLVVDSRLIATNLGIQHEAVIKNIRKYATKFQAMGVLRFEIGKLEDGSTGRPGQFIYLNELQSNFLMTLSKNTDAVVECKFNLSIAFDKAKSIIKTVIPAQNDRLRELETELQLERERNKRIDRQDSMLIMHGRDVVLALNGCSDAVVREQVKVTEVINLTTGSTDVFLSADQLKSEVQKRTGQKVKSQKAFTDALRKAGRDDLLIAVTRSATSEYVTPERLDEAIGIVYGKQRQKLIGE
jgi:phage regulator Rha-like protein